MPSPSASNAAIGRAEAGPGPADDREPPDEVGRRDPSLPLGQFDLQGGRRIEPGRRNGLGGDSIDERVDHLGVAALVAVGGNHFITHADTAFLPSSCFQRSSSFRLPSGSPSEPVGNGQPIDGGREVRVAHQGSLERGDLLGDFFLGRLGPSAAPGAVSTHGRAQPVPTMCIVRVLVGDDPEIGVGQLEFLNLLIDEPSTVPGMQVAGVVLDDGAQDLECPTGRGLLECSNAAPIDGRPLVHQGDRQVDRAGAPPRRQLVDPAERLGGTLVIIALDQPDAAVMLGQDRIEVLRRDAVIPPGFGAVGAAAAGGRAAPGGDPVQPDNPSSSIGVRRRR